MEKFILVNKVIAGVAAVEVVEMLTSTGQEFDEDKMIPLKPGDTPISRSWGRKTAGMKLRMVYV